MQKHRQIHDILNRASAEEDDFQRLNANEDEVRRVFQHVNPNKATGPVNILHHEYLRHALNSLLTLFALYLVRVSPQILFQLPGRLHDLLDLVPIPKRPVISSMNDLRPVALSSAVMKVCEHVVLCKLEKLVRDFIDPLQFAYRKNRSPEVRKYLLAFFLLFFREKAGSTLRFMFFDFSSAFNTIQPHLLVQKLLNMKLPSSVIS